MYYGCEKTTLDKRDYKFKVTSPLKEYPEEYSMEMPDVKDQGIVNSCVAYALSVYMEESELENKTKFSTGWIYGYRPLGYTQDEGMNPRQGIKTLLHVGAVEKDDFDHNKEMPEIRNLVDKNLDRLKVLASLHKIESYARIYSEKDIKKCLYANVPVPVVIPVRKDLELENNCILLNLEKPITGYHMMVIYGWNESGWLVQNSWGKEWGNKGRAILPYDYEIDSAWAISTKTNNISTYQTIWQKICKFILDLADKLRVTCI